MTNKITELQANGSLFLAQALIAFSIICLKAIDASNAALFILFIRFISGSVCLLVIMKASQPQKKLHLVKQWRSLPIQQKIALIGQAVCAGLLFNFFMILGLQFTSALQASIIFATLPAMVLLFSILLLGATLKKEQWLWMGIACFGIMLTTMSKQSSHATHPILGNLIILIALIPESSYYILIKKYPSKLAALPYAFYINLSNAIICLPFFVYTYSAHSLPGLSLHQWMLLIASGIASALFYYFWAKGSQQTSAIRAAISLAYLPISGLILAWLLLGNTPQWVNLSGLFLIILSILGIERKRSAKGPALKKLNI